MKQIDKQVHETYYQGFKDIDRKSNKSARLDNSKVSSPKYINEKTLKENLEMENHGMNPKTK